MLWTERCGIYALTLDSMFTSVSRPRCNEYSRSVFGNDDRAIVGFSKCIISFKHEDQACFLATTYTVSHYLLISRGALCSTRTAVIDTGQSRESVNSCAAQSTSYATPFYSINMVAAKTTALLVMLSRAMGIYWLWSLMSIHVQYVSEH